MSLQIPQKMDPFSFFSEVRHGLHDNIISELSTIISLSSRQDMLFVSIYNMFYNSVADPDPHQSERQDPDPTNSQKQDPDPDPHHSQEAVEAWKGAVVGHKRSQMAAKLIIVGRPVIADLHHFDIDKEQDPYPE